MVFRCRFSVEANNSSFHNLFTDMSEQIIYEKLHTFVTLHTQKHSSNIQLLCGLTTGGYNIVHKTFSHFMTILTNSSVVHISPFICYTYIIFVFGGVFLIQSNWTASSVWRCVILRVFLLLKFNYFGYFASSNPSLPESSCRHFLPLHAWLPFRIQNGRFIQGSKIKLKSMSLYS